MPNVVLWQTVPHLLGSVFQILDTAEQLVFQLVSHMLNRGPVQGMGLPWKCLDVM